MTLGAVMETSEVAAEQLLRRPALRSRPMGGSVSEVQMQDGERVMAKSLPSKNAVQAEAASLAWLAEPGAVRIPRVRGYNNQWLISEFVVPGRPTTAGAEELGRGLAALHRSGAPAFGCPPPGGPIDATIGMASMRNIECPNWAEFYSAHRIAPFLKIAVDQKKLDLSQAEVFERVIAGIDRLAGPAESPARIHGDLWSGNIVWAEDGKPWLIDPAAHGGHRETDLAMLRLFGCPHLDLVFGAYEQQTPLSQGWQERIPLHQIFPLLVHTVLFGGSYSRQAVEAARAALRP